MFLILCGPVHARELSFQFHKSELLPEVKLHGEEAHFHTQGLFVTNTFFFVTARLESPPRRAFILKFHRNDLTKYELLDITPKTPAGFDATLDHPGGFDSDGSHFWIPIALSKSVAPTLIVKLPIPTDMKLGELSPEIAFQVNDHIGAVCFDKSKNVLYGANWDTNKIYTWDTSGKIMSVIDRAKFVNDEPGWQLAVQDWKVDRGLFDRPVIIAGGLNKSANKDVSKPMAIVDFIDLANRKRVCRLYLPDRDDTMRPLTNEGLAIFKDELFLLPEDLGHRAKVLRFRLESAD